MKDYCKCLFTQLPLQTQSQEISQTLIFHHTVWHTQQCGDGALIAASAWSRARGAILAHQKFVLYQLLVPVLHPVAQAPQFGSWGTAGIPSCGDHVLMDRLRGWICNDVLRYILYPLLLEQAPGFYRQPGNTHRQGSFFSQTKEDLWIRHKWGEGEKRSYAFTKMLLLLATSEFNSFNNLILVEISALPPETCCSVTHLFGIIFC